MSPTPVHAAQVQTFWLHVEAWAQRENIPATFFAPPATPQELDTLDATLPTGCPDLLRALLARHNGAGAGWFALGGGHILSSVEVVAERRERGRLANTMLRGHTVRAVGPVRRDPWSDLWIPVFKRNKEPVVLDLAPAAGGSVGQVVEVDWEGGKNTVLAPDLAQFLQTVTASLAP